MIPKIIHYCWFGGAPLDEKAKNCIASWRSFFPDYEIIQWDESNFDVKCIDFTEKAYNDKRWAFVSDVARLMIVYKYGGIYFDTDVEVIRSFADILEKAEVGFLGMDNHLFISSGLGFGAKKGAALLHDFLKTYETLDYNDYKDRLSEIACPVLMSKYFQDQGVIIKPGVQKVFGFDIYPHEYFNPLDYMTGKVVKTENTHSIHWYNDSWNSEENRANKKQLQAFRRFFGEQFGEKVYGVHSTIRKEGILQYINKRLIKK